jgi:thiamine monophosphate kinase
MGACSDRERDPVLVTSAKGDSAAGLEHLVNCKTGPNPGLRAARLPRLHPRIAAQVVAVQRLSE